MPSLKETSRHLWYAHAVLGIGNREEASLLLVCDLHHLELGGWH